MPVNSTPVGGGVSIPSPDVLSCRREVRFRVMAMFEFSEAYIGTPSNYPEDGLTAARKAFQEDNRPHCSPLAWAAPVALEPLRSLRRLRSPPLLLGLRDSCSPAIVGRPKRHSS
eukprot:13091482-Alexandrium_andersonii.AAC.1